MKWYLVLIVELLSCIAFAQTPDINRSALSVPVVLHTDAQLVMVDVTVQDKEGRPVRGLKRENFSLNENKQSQAIRYFEEHSGQVQPKIGPELPPMPAGTFTNYTSVPPGGTLNVLLLDTLNTPMADQAYVQSQLQQYVRKIGPGTRIAVFGLSQRLFMLQGFSSDPQVLKNVVEHKLLPRGSSLLEDVMGAGSSSEAPSDIVAEGLPAGQDPAATQLTSVVSSMKQFEAGQRAFETQLRVQYTLDAFNTLAHYLAAFPGRKNLIWFSGSFPLNVLPDPSLAGGSVLPEDNNPEFRETVNLLSRAQVAVYPVDARGLMTDPSFSAANRKNDPVGTSSAQFYQSQADEHMTMSQLAKNTGGAAFYSTNNLALSVQHAIESGANYYTLMYSPSNKGKDGAYREIHVALSGVLQVAGYQLAYRRGYYTIADVDSAKHDATGIAATSHSALNDRSEMYARAAMAHGAPAPEDILFKVRVLPSGVVPEQTLAAANNIDPTHPIQPPFRRFAVDISAVPDAFVLTRNQEGRYAGIIAFNVLLYDSDGRLLNATGKEVELNLTSEAYKGFLHGVNAHFEMSVPIKGNDSFLRIGVRDVPSNRFGVVEIPVSSVAHLTPLSAGSIPAQPTLQHQATP